MIGLFVVGKWGWDGKKIKPSVFVNVKPGLCLYHLSTSTVLAQDLTTAVNTKHSITKSWGPYSFLICRLRIGLVLVYSAAHHFHSFILHSLNTFFYSSKNPSKPTFSENNEKNKSTHPRLFISTACSLFSLRAIGLNLSTADTQPELNN